MDKTWGEIAYEAYGNQVEWKNYLGKPMPNWFELPANIQQAWQAAGWATVCEWVKNENGN